MKKSAFLLLFVVLATTVFAQKSDSRTFNSQLSVIKATFKMPKKFEAVNIKSNKQITYEFAMKDASQDFEVRYSYYPVTKKAMATYHACVKNPDCSSITPNAFYESIFMDNLLRMSNIRVKSSSITNSTVKSSYNGDKGRTSALFTFKSDFGQGYKYGQAMIIHKDNVGDFFVVFMSNNSASLSANMNRASKALKFK